MVTHPTRGTRARRTRRIMLGTKCRELAQSEQRRKPSQTVGFAGVVAGWGVRCGCMRTASTLALTLVLAASTAHATSFANRGLGLGIGFMKIISDDSTVPEFCVPLWLELPGISMHKEEPAGRSSTPPLTWRASMANAGEQAP